MFSTFNLFLNFTLVFDLLRYSIRTIDDDDDDDGGDDDDGDGGQPYSRTFHLVRYLKENFSFFFTLTRSIR